MQPLEEIKTLSDKHNAERNALCERLEKVAQKSDNVQEGDVWILRGDVVEVINIKGYSDIETQDLLIEVDYHLTFNNLTKRGLLIYRDETKNDTRIIKDW